MAVPGSNKLKLRIGDREIEIEGEPEHIAKVIAHLLVLGTTGVAISSPSLQAGTMIPAGGAQPPVVDIRTFFKDKQPASDNEAAATVAYYYKFVALPEERRDTIDRATLEDAFRLANWPLPGRTLMTLVHAKDAGYLSLADKGLYRLTTVGHNLVAHTLGPAVKTNERPIRRGSKSRSRAVGKG